MATALDVINGAIKLLGVRAAESPITSAEAQDGLTALNDMASMWESEKGINIGFEPVEDVDDTLYVDDGVIGGLKSNLAVYIAPEYNKSVAPELAMRAEREMKAIRASRHNLVSDFPDSLPVGSGNEDNNFVADGDVPGGLQNNRFYPGNVTDKCS